MRAHRARRRLEIMQSGETAQPRDIAGKKTLKDYFVARPAATAKLRVHPAGR